VKQLLLILLLVGTLFADFNSLAEEEAYKKKEQSKEEALRKEYERQLEEKIMPRVENLKKFNRQYCEKYLVKETDTPAMIDEKFKNINNLYPQMIKNYKASVAESKYLWDRWGDLCEKMGEDVVPKSKNCFRAALDNTELSSLKYKEFITEYIYGYTSYGTGGYFKELDRRLKSGDTPYQDGFPTTSTEESRVLEYYKEYLRDCYKSYEDRQEKAKEAKEREERKKQEEKKYEARSKEIAAERKKVEPACQKWRASLKNQVNSLGVGDKVTIREANATPYTIETVHANIFVVKQFPQFRYNFKKSDCIPYDALRSAPSPYCYK